MVRIPDCQPVLSGSKADDDVDDVEKGSVGGKVMYLP